jgi:methylenetetrahydrofolate dehydrogenase (NADP+)/methenyltetrahydrofolate cyclohydrolase
MAPTPTARIIDGRSLAQSVRDQLSQEVKRLADLGKAVRLDAVIVGDNAAGSVYATNQAKMCQAIGIAYHLHELPSDASACDVEAKIDALNRDDAVTAVMVHLPLPEAIDTHRVQAMIDIDKDIEGVNPGNIGGVIYGRRTLVPCTALAIMRMIESTDIDLVGAQVACVGASTIVGRPVAVLLMEAQATVISTNVHTEDLAAHTKRADVVISAAGVPALVTGDMIKPGAIIIDVGINRVVNPETGKTHTVGDVDFDSVAPVASYISPVPGGVGPMTVAMLLRNTVAAADSD